MRDAENDSISIVRYSSGKDQATDGRVVAVTHGLFATTVILGGSPRIAVTRITAPLTLLHGEGRAVKVMVKGRTMWKSYCETSYEHAVGAESGRSALLQTAKRSVLDAEFTHLVAWHSLAALELLESTARVPWGCCSCPPPRYVRYLPFLMARAWIIRLEIFQESAVEVLIIGIIRSLT